ncbi:MAG TPA: peptide deformylase [Trueperaceae bacterium]|nr:peptide deformylase [Trueperaceae bacterium]
MIYPIRYYGDPILRRRASPVTTFDAALERLAADMIETMYAADGIGLAAPQIGIAQRMFVALEVAANEEDEQETAGQLAEPDDAARAEQGGSADDDVADGYEQPETTEEKRRAWGVVKEHVIINPVMVSRSGRQFGRDGCLSLPGLIVEEVPRAQSVVLEYQDLSGNKQKLTAAGYFAHVLQHEFDHLEGVLFFDHLPPARRDLFLEENRTQLAEWQRDARARLKSPAAQQHRSRAS